MTGQVPLLIVAGFAAGVQNALAGGGSFLTFPALLFAGLDARAANISSTIALFPGQVTAGLAGRKLARGAGGLGFSSLLWISLAGGAVGAVLLLVTPSAVFARLVPFLVLFATLVFAWGNFARRPTTEAPAATTGRGIGGAMAAQFLIAVYGGYFGGGIGFLMLAAFTITGVAVRNAGATKNILAAAMNASAVLVFLIEARVHWVMVAYIAVASVAGGRLGAFILGRVDERWLRIGVVVIGAILTIGLFIETP